MNGKGEKGEIKIKAAEVKEDEAFKYFHEKHDISDITWEGYITSYQRYVEFTKLSLSDLIKEAEKEEFDRVPLERRKIGNRLRGYRKHLKEIGLSPSTIQKMVAAVKSFYVNGYSLQIPKLGKDRDLVAKVKIENKGIPTKEEIFKVLGVADKREKAIILAIASSGLSAKDFVSLTIKQFREGYDNQIGITTLDLRRAKTQQDFTTFLSVEASDAVIDYLKWRDRKKPKTSHKDLLKSWEKHQIFNDDDYLICKKYIPDRYLTTSDEELRKESEAGLQTVFRTLANRAGIARDSGMWNIFRGHKLRSWFYSTMLNGGCPQEFLEQFMGHISKLGSSGGTYYTAIIPKLKEIYLEYMPHLALIQPIETRVLTTESYKEMKEDLKVRDEIIKELREGVEKKDKEFEQRLIELETYKWNIENTEKVEKVNAIKREYERRYGTNLTKIQKQRRNEKILKIQFDE